MKKAANAPQDSNEYMDHGEMFGSMSPGAALTDASKSLRQALHADVAPFINKAVLEEDHTLPKNSQERPKSFPGQGDEVIIIDADSPLDNSKVSEPSVST